MKRSSHTSGFTLVELLVSSALFLVVMTISVGTLLTLVDANRKAQSLKTAMDNVQFALDGMARNIRTGYDIDCDPGSPGLNDCDTGSDGLTFVSDDGCNITYFFDDTPGVDAIFRRIEGGDPGCADDSAPLPLTDEKVVIEDMRLWVTGATVGDDEQPTVTIAIQGTTKIDPNIDTDFNIQTTVVQRVLDL